MGLKENLRELEALRRMLAVTAGQSGFGQEIRQARKKRGLTLEALAGATGIAKSYLSQIETGYAPPPRDDKVRRIAEALGLDAEALVARAHLAQLPENVKARVARLREIFDSTEEAIRALLAAKEGTALPAAGSADETEASDASIDLDALHESGLLHHLAEWGAARVQDRPDKVRSIPVINKVAAGYPEGFTDLGYPVGVADDYIAVPAELDDPSAFAVRVVGDSMEPKYKEGDIVILSPAAEVVSGDDCFVRFSLQSWPNGGETTFKRVFFDSETEVRLQPLNEKYAPTVVKPAEIEGIFCAVARYERL